MATIYTIYQCQNGAGTQSPCGAFDRDRTTSPPQQLNCWKCKARDAMKPLRPDLQAEGLKRFLAQEQSGGIV